MKTRPSVLVACSLLLLGGLGACMGAEQESAEPPSLLGVDNEPAGNTPPVDSPEELVPARWARRMQVDRLQASIPIVAGNDIEGNPIIWRVNGKDALGDDVFGQILGRPDYVLSTAENPAPSSLYLKFMRDMARDVCSQIVASDLQREQDHTLWRYAPIDGSASDEQVSDNLRYLAHRWLGLRLSADEPLIADLRVVFDAGTQSLAVDAKSPTAQAEGWRGVCIALFESPTFHLD